MRLRLLHAGLVSSILCSTGLLAQHAGIGVPAPPSTSPARSLAPPARQIVPSRSGHWPSWNGGTGTTNENLKRPARQSYPYVYPGLLSFGYGVTGGYGLAPGEDQAAVSAAAPQGSGPEMTDQQLAESAPALYRPPYLGPSDGPVAPLPPPPVRQQPATTLIFKDGRPQKLVHNYALMGTNLWALDGDTRQEIPLAALDIPAMVKVNRDAGVDFALPGGR